MGAPGVGVSVFLVVVEAGRFGGFWKWVYPSLFYALTYLKSHFNPALYQCKNIRRLYPFLIHYLKIKQADRMTEPKIDLVF